jgi:hypothetical protein
MDDKHIHSEGPFSASGNTTPPAEEPTVDSSSAAPAKPAYNPRLQRIHDHRAEAVYNQNSLKACLACVNSDLFEAEMWVGDALRKVRAEGGFTLEEIEKYARLFDLLIRIAKQTSVLSQLEMRAEKRELPAM